MKDNVLFLYQEVKMNNLFLYTVLQNAMVPTGPEQNTVKETVSEKPIYKNNTHFNMLVYKYKSHYHKSTVGQVPIDKGLL